jgi:hypothetical protein
VGIRTDFRDAADNFGRKKFLAIEFRDEVTLISELFIYVENRDFYPEDLEYKQCPLDLTLTGMLLQRFMDAAQTYSTTNSYSTQL